MKECPSCRRVYSGEFTFCSTDGTRLIRSVQSPSDLSPSKGHRLIPPPPKPLPMRLTIIDQSDEGHRSRVIDGVVLDVGQQGMRIKTGTVETGELHIVRDHTIAFKNKLELEITLPNATVKCTGFAAWYKPDEGGLCWVVGIYIRDMSAADRQAYDEYLKTLSSSATESAPA